LDCLKPDDLVTISSASQSLNVDQVHIWLVNLDLLGACQAFFWELLSEQEKAQANGFYFEQKRSWFIARRGFLRVKLSTYLGQPAGSLRFRHMKYGKPFLDEPKLSHLEFNISHSYEMALFAFALDRQIGIDLERRRDDFDPLDLAERFFSPTELKALQSLPADRRVRGFFKCWTRKEAFIKACGNGLWMPHDQFDVSVSPDEPARLLATRGDLEPPDAWSLIEIPVWPEFEAALVAHGPTPEIKCFKVDACKPEDFIHLNLQR